MTTIMTTAMLGMANLFARLLAVTTPDVTFAQLAELCAGIEAGTVPYETVDELLKAPADSARVGQAINDPFSLLSTRTVVAREMSGIFPKTANLDYVGVTREGVQYVMGHGNAWWNGKDLGIYGGHLIEGKIIRAGFLVSDGQYGYKVQTPDGPTNIVSLSKRQPLYYDLDKRIIFDNESGEIWPWSHDDDPDHVAVSANGHVCVLTGFECDYYRWDKEIQAFRKLEVIGYEFDSNEHDWPVSIDVRGNRTVILTEGYAILFQDDKYVESFNVWPVDHGQKGEVLLRNDGEVQVYTSRYHSRQWHGNTIASRVAMQDVQRLGDSVCMLLHKTLTVEDHRSEQLVVEKGMRGAHFVGQYLVQYKWHEHRRTEMTVFELRPTDHGRFRRVKVFSMPLVDGHFISGKETPTGFRLVVSDSVSRRLVEYRRDGGQSYVIKLPPQHKCNLDQVVLVGDRLVAVVSQHARTWYVVDAYGIIENTKADCIFHLRADGNVLRWYARQRRNAHDCACRAT